MLHLCSFSWCGCSTTASPGCHKASYHTSRPARPSRPFRSSVLHHSLEDLHASLGSQSSAACPHRQAPRHPIAMQRRGFAASAKTELCKPHHSATRIATKGFLHVERRAHVSSASLLFRDLQSLTSSTFLPWPSYLSFSFVPPFSEFHIECAARNIRFMIALDHITQLWR